MNASRLVYSHFNLIRPLHQESPVERKAAKGTEGEDDAYCHGHVHDIDRYITHVSYTIATFHFDAQWVLLRASVRYAMLYLHYYGNRLFCFDMSRACMRVFTNSPFISTGGALKNIGFTMLIDTEIKVTQDATCDNRDYSGDRMRQHI